MRSYILCRPTDMSIPKTQMAWEFYNFSAIDSQSPRSHRPTSRCLAVRFTSQNELCTVRFATRYFISLRHVHAACVTKVWSILYTKSSTWTVPAAAAQSVENWYQQVSRTESEAVNRRPAPCAWRHLQAANDQGDNMRPSAASRNCFASAITEHTKFLTSV